MFVFGGAGGGGGVGGGFTLVVVSFLRKTRCGVDGTKSVEKNISKHALKIMSCNFIVLECCSFLCFVSKKSQELLKISI